jgi:hypothetical protein
VRALVQVMREEERSWYRDLEMENNYKMLQKQKEQLMENFKFTQAMRQAPLKTKNAVFSL